jgi:hypothetical protein
VCPDAGAILRASRAAAAASSLHARRNDHESQRTPRSLWTPRMRTAQMRRRPEGSRRSV